MTPLQHDERWALDGQRDATIRVVSALREYRKLVETMRNRHEMHQVWADADAAVPLIEGVEDE
jgi:hypothetical protein